MGAFSIPIIAGVVDDFNFAFVVRIANYSGAIRAAVNEIILHPTTA